MRIPPACALLVGLFAAFGSPSVLCAVDFRVDSKVFADKESVPRSSNVTLFQGQRVYDFLDKPQQITIYDLKNGSTVLVDPDRQVRVNVSRATIDAFCNSLRHIEAKTDDPLLKFALRPEFDERSGKGPAERIFESKHLTYQIKTEREPAAGLSQEYQKFGDASARLNALVNRGSLPPFPRIAVNQSLAAAGEVPLNIQVSFLPRQVLGRTVVLRSQHEYHPRLLDADQSQIDHALALEASTAAVSLSEYLRSSAKSAK